MFRTLRAAAAGAATICAILPGTALAGTYSVTQVLNSDTTGWTASPADGISTCGLASLDPACSVLATPTPLSVLGTGAAAAGATGRWVWTAPPGLSVASGTVSVYRAIAARDTTVYLQTAGDGQNLADQPRQNETKGAGTVDWAIGAGTQQIGVALSTAKAVAYPGGVANLIKASRLQVTLEDDTSPSLTATSTDAPDGQVCVAVNASDTGSGVKSVQIVGEGLATLASTPRLPAQSVFQPGAASVQQNLCVAQSKLTPGSGIAIVSATDAAGNSTTAPVTAAAAATGPGVVSTFPANGSKITDHTTGVAVYLNQGSGSLRSASATLDNSQQLTLTKLPSTSMLAWAPTTSAQALANGVHTVRWTATDTSGNTTSGSYSFTVFTGPQISATGALVSTPWFNAASGSTCATVTVSDPDGSIAEVDVYGGPPNRFITSFKGPARAGGTVDHTVCANPRTFGSDGTYNLTITATDSAGLTNSYGARLNVDTTPPVMTSFGPTGSVSSPLNVYMSWSDATSGFGSLRYDFDGGQPITQGGNIRGMSINGVKLAAGMHTVHWTLTDTAGNSTSGQFSFTVTG